MGDSSDEDSSDDEEYEIPLPSDEFKAAMTRAIITWNGEYALDDLIEESISEINPQLKIGNGDFIQLSEFNQIKRDKEIEAQTIVRYLKLLTERCKLGCFFILNF